MKTGQTAGHRYYNWELLGKSWDQVGCDYCRGVVATIQQARTSATLLCSEEVAIR